MGKDQHLNKNKERHSFEFANYLGTFNSELA